MFSFPYSTFLDVRAGKEEYETVMRRGFMEIKIRRKQGKEEGERKGANDNRREEEMSEEEGKNGGIRSLDNSKVQRNLVRRRRKEGK